MDEELVSPSSSVSDSEEGGKNRSPFLLTEQFEEVFPYYLSIGMTPHQFWCEDVGLAAVYRKAERYRIDQKNWELHLQGLYIYEALCDVAPVLQAFAKKGTKVAPYPEKPYELFDEAHTGETDNGESKVTPEEKARYNRNKAYVEAFSSSFNKMMQDKKRRELNG